MIYLKCGMCGCEYSLSEKMVAAGKASNRCPNCGSEMDLQLSTALIALSKALMISDHTWKVDIDTFPKENRRLKVQGTLNLK